MNIPTIRARKAFEGDNYCPAIPLIVIHPPLFGVMRNARWYAHTNKLNWKEREEKNRQMHKAIKDAQE